VALERGGQVALRGAWRRKLLSCDKQSRKMATKPSRTVGHHRGYWLRNRVLLLSLVLKTVPVGRICDFSTIKRVIGKQPNRQWKLLNIEH